MNDDDTLHVHVIDLSDPVRDATIEALITKLSDAADGAELDHLLNALAGLSARTIRTAAKVSDISCIGWGYRCVDKSAEHVKDLLAAYWAQPLGEENTLGDTPAAGNC